jgi:hypothetical protein
MCCAPGRCILGVSGRSIESLNVWAVTGWLERGEKRKPGPDPERVGWLWYAVGPARLKPRIRRHSCSQGKPRSTRRSVPKRSSIASSSMHSQIGAAQNRSQDQSWTASQADALLSPRSVDSGMSSPPSGPVHGLTTPDCRSDKRGASGAIYVSLRAAWGWEPALRPLEAFRRSRRIGRQ